ncbi:MAG TPA: porin [Leucothrix mucor]|uniref:Porin n=1 Tax=Leucothrix mucor TaxID=45248 RepID=A0A7V2T1N3_LEUMU|nr:porin [Leucothrix mucor]
MKKLLAIAVAAGLAAPMAVMADTTLYGKMKVSVGSNKNAAGDSVTTVEAHSSRIGVKGSTPMDNGMSITHKVEFSTKNAIDNSTGGTAALGARDAWVGMKGNFGEVRVGRHATPLSLSSDAYDIMNVGGHKSIGNGPFRVSNAIAYLKGFGPVGFAAAYVPDETHGVNSDVISTLINYSSNGIYTAWGHQKAKGGTATDTLTLGYTAPAGHKASLVYNKTGDYKGTALNGRYKFGKAYVQAEIGKVKDVDGSYKVGELGYKLGKGTTVWTSLGKNDMAKSKASHARIGITSNF